MTDYVSPKQIADVAGLTEKHVRRMVSRAEGAGPFVSGQWFGQRLQVVREGDAKKVAFTTLPQHIREAFVSLAQLDLPLPPPWGSVKILKT